MQENPNEVEFKNQPELASKYQETCLVHATKYPPMILPDGSLGIQTTSKALGIENVARTTIHFALGHPVESVVNGMQ